MDTVQLAREVFHASGGHVVLRMDDSASGYFHLEAAKDFHVGEDVFVDRRALGMSCPHDILGVKRVFDLVPAARAFGEIHGGEGPQFSKPAVVQHLFNRTVPEAPMAFGPSPSDKDLKRMVKQVLRHAARDDVPRICTGLVHHAEPDRTQVLEMLQPQLAAARAMTCVLSHPKLCGGVVQVLSAVAGAAAAVGECSPNVDLGVRGMPAPNSDDMYVFDLQVAAVARRPIACGDRIVVVPAAAAGTRPDLTPHPRIAEDAREAQGFFRMWSLGLLTGVADRAAFLKRGTCRKQ